METPKISYIPGGTVTSAKGFIAGAVHAGIRKGTTGEESRSDKGKLDLGILLSEAPCTAAGVFTMSRIKSAPVILCREKVKSGKAVAIVVNSGCANAYTGEQGVADAVEMTAMAAASIGASPDEVFVTSTGVTGHLLPMKLIREGIKRIVLSPDGGHKLAMAIMTTDTVPKETAVSVSDGKIEYTIGGIAKGSGMIHPNMGTMFCFLATDAAVEIEFLRSTLKRAADVSFNMISVDGDTSPSDTVLVLANGQAGNEPITKDSPQAGAFQKALEDVCIYLARALARDGEGATKLIEATVSGAATEEDARKAAKVVIGSTLIKTAVYGGDPNWGRIVMALGHAGVELALEDIDLSIGEVNLLKGGRPLDFRESDVMRIFKQDEVPISINLNSGTASATAWGCDLSEAYVAINSAYMT